MKKLFQNSVITRFAPSPTGLFHIGSVRTALFNYLYAKKNNGKFYLRIEDTDKERSKPEYEKDIIESLEWLGLKWDGSLTRQSERPEIYKEYLEKLLKEDKAYYCFCSPEELEAMKQEQMSRGVAPKYTGNCAKLTNEEVKSKIDQGKSFVIRLRAEAKKVSFDDLIRGPIEFDTSLIGDFVIAKNLDEPLYNFSVVIDDFDMKITEVIRGEDHISNTPRQILIGEALGFKPPRFAHLPLILGPDKSKMSKRHGAVSLTEFKNEGYLKEALINFVSFLGWNPGTEKEMYSMQELIRDFSLEKIQKGGAVFNIEKLDNINGQYIRQTPAHELGLLCAPYLISAGLVDPGFRSQEVLPDLTGYLGREIVPHFSISETGEELSQKDLEGIVLLYRDRLKKLSEISDLTEYFFKKNLVYTKDLLKWKDLEGVAVCDVLVKVQNILENIKEKDWKKEKLEKILLEESEKISLELRGKTDRGYVLWPLRVSLTGQKFSAGPFDIAAVYGKEKTLERITSAINFLKNE
jgi:glutamyl-tRNA synthetase